VHQSRGPVAGGPWWTPGGGGQGARGAAFLGAKPHRERTKRRRAARGFSPQSCMVVGCSRLGR
jgi:hypothetical protein